MIKPVNPYGDLEVRGWHIVPAEAWEKGFNTCWGFMKQHLEMCSCWSLDGQWRTVTKEGWEGIFKESGGLNDSTNKEG